MPVTLLLRRDEASPTADQDVELTLLVRVVWMVRVDKRLSGDEDELQAKDYKLGCEVHLATLGTAVDAEVMTVHDVAVLLRRNEVWQKLNVSVGEAHAERKSTCREPGTKAGRR